MKHYVINRHDDSRYPLYVLSIPNSESLWEHIGNRETPCYEADYDCTSKESAEAEMNRLHEAWAGVEQ